MPRATPYSVMEVPRMGMSPVAATAAWRAVVPLHRIRSTPWDTKLLMMVVQLAASPEAFCSWISTEVPSFSSRVSMKPRVASSSATCCIC